MIGLVAQAAPSALPSLWELVKSGGPLMWPLGLCSLVALALAFERWLALRETRLGGERLARDVHSALRSGGAPAARTLIESRSTPLSRILDVALRSHPSGDARERAVEDVATAEVRELSAKLKPLHMVYIVAPLLGLLGTVWGLIEAFAVVATQNALGRPEMLASGVYQALVTTAAGLAIAIPTLVVYQHLRGRVERFARKTEGFYAALENDLELAAHAHP